MNYPILVSASDTGTLSDILRNTLVWIGTQTPAMKLVSGAAVGAVVGHFAGKHTKLGAAIGAALFFYFTKAQ